MSTIQNTLHRQAALRAALRGLAHDEPSMRDLCHRSELTRATLRQILKSGDVASYVTAVALEIASGGLIIADQCSEQAVKGRAPYSRHPAKADSVSSPLCISLVSDNKVELA